MNESKDVFCPQCQSQTTSSSKFCNECGADLTVSCPICEKNINFESKFCEYCGANLESINIDALEEEKQYYESAKNGGISECNTYMEKYKNGHYNKDVEKLRSEYKARKKRFPKEFFLVDLLIIIGVAIVIVLMNDEKKNSRNYRNVPTPGQILQERNASAYSITQNSHENAERKYNETLQNEQSELEAIKTKVNDCEEDLGNSLSKHKEFIELLNESIESLKSLKLLSTSDWINVYDNKYKQTQNKIEQFNLILQIELKVKNLFKQYLGSTSNSKNMYALSSKLSTINTTEVPYDLQIAITNLRDIVNEMGDYLEYDESGKAMLEGAIRGYGGDPYGTARDRIELYQKLKTEFEKCVKKFVEIIAKYRPTD